MLTRTVLVLLAAFIVPGAWADFIVKEQVENAGKTQDVVLKIKGDKCRLETSDQTAAIIDANTGETTILIHPQKVYMKITGEQLRAQTEALKNMLGNKDHGSGTGDFSPTGKTEKINGYDTEEYTTSVNGMTTTVACDKSFPNYQTVVKAMYNVQSGPGLEFLRGLTIPPDKYPGMPIRTIVEILGQRITTTLSSVEEANLNDSEFAVPDDYKEINPAAAPAAPHQNQTSDPNKTNSQ